MHCDNFLIEIWDPRGEDNSSGIGELERRMSRRTHEKEVEEDFPMDRLPYTKAQGLESIQSPG